MHKEACANQDSEMDFEEDVDAVSSASLMKDDGTLVTHGGSGAGNSVEDIRKLCKADVSNNVLEVFDDDVTNAAGVVAEWLESLH